jgi:hypothetical protein
MGIKKLFQFAPATLSAANARATPPAPALPCKALMIVMRVRTNNLADQIIDGIDVFPRCLRRVI